MAAALGIVLAGAATRAVQITRLRVVVEGEAVLPVDVHVVQQLAGTG